MKLLDKKILTGGEHLATIIYPVGGRPNPLVIAHWIRRAELASGQWLDWHWFGEEILVWCFGQTDPAWAGLLNSRRHLPSHEFGSKLRGRARALAQLDRLTVTRVPPLRDYRDPYTGAPPLTRGRKAAGRPLPPPPLASRDRGRDRGRGRGRGRGWQDERAS